MTIYEIGEILMLISFGFSWPFNAVKSYKARTTKGKSLPFLLRVVFGYIRGIVAKLTNPNGFKWYVMFFYVLNVCMVLVDVALYFRNLRLDRAAKQA